LTRTKKDNFVKNTLLNAFNLIEEKL